MGPVGTEALDRDDLVLLRIGQSHQTRAYRLAVEMDGASAASADTATKFGSGQADDVADGPSMVCSTSLILICGMGFLSGCCYGAQLISSVC
jgi:hypothetical protein